ncbi:hypothetical protein BH23VER1_BH23VER1_21310 [soil metagenome]
MDSTQSHCPRCKRELKPDVPGGHCPACLMEINLQSGFGRSGTGGRIAPLPLEEVAGRFPEMEILGLLGSGGMGTVYKARQPKLDRLVALKILTHERDDAGFIDRFTREAQTLARLDHPNIVAVHEFGDRGELFYLIMELVDGVTLRDLLSEGRLKPDQALAIVPPICDALQFAHDKGVVHRDIKPENILLDKDGRVKVADFGIARLVGLEQAATLTGRGQVVGTAHYMSPEQVERPATVDHRADIYALGVVFYEMLTGELPLGRFPNPSEKVQIDVRLDEVVLKALEKEPRRRYQHASEVRTRVEDIVATDRNPSRPALSSVFKTRVLLMALIFSAVWGYFAELQNEQIGWFLGRLAITPLIVLGLFKIMESSKAISRTTAALAVLVTGLGIFIIFAGSPTGYTNVVQGEEHAVNAFPLRDDGVSKVQQIEVYPEVQIAQSAATPGTDSVPALAWGIACVGFVVLGLLAARLRKQLKTVLPEDNTGSGEGKFVPVDKSIFGTAAAMAAVVVGLPVLFIVFGLGSWRHRNVNVVEEFPGDEGVSSVLQFDLDPEVRIARPARH